MSKSTMPIVPDPRRREIEQGRGAQATGADEQHLRLAAASPDPLTYFRHHEVARVARVRCDRGSVLRELLTVEPSAFQRPMPPATE